MLPLASHRALFAPGRADPTADGGMRDPEVGESESVQPYISSVEGSPRSSGWQFLWVLQYSPSGVPWAFIVDRVG